MGRRREFILGAAKLGKQKLRFFFDYNGACLWNNGAINHELLPISTDLANELNALCDEFDAKIDWNCPLSSIPWTQEQDDSFKHRATVVYEKLKTELESDYEIINEL